MRVVGRTRNLPLLLGGWRNSMTGIEPAMAFHGRTIFPASWFTGEVSWLRILARHFRLSLGIAEGELRALQIWTTILLSVPSAVRREIIAITDNTAVAGIAARGRASVGNLNRLIRTIAAVFFFTWDASCLRLGWTRITSPPMAARGPSEVFCRRGRCSGLHAITLQCLEPAIEN